MPVNNLISLLILVGSLVVAAAAAIHYGQEFLENLRQPVVQLPAQIIARRIQKDHGGGWTPDARYFVTFATETGEKREYAVSESEFPRLAEGRSGILTARGAWYRGFRG